MARWYQASKAIFSELAFSSRIEHENSGEVSQESGPISVQTPLQLARLLHYLTLDRTLPDTSCSNRHQLLIGQPDGGNRFQLCVNVNLDRPQVRQHLIQQDRSSPHLARRHVDFAVHMGHQAVDDFGAGNALSGSAGVRTTFGHCIDPIEVFWAWLS